MRQLLKMYQMRLLKLYFIVLLLACCKKEGTQWQSQWLLPLVNDTLSLANYYNDSTLIQNAGQIEVNLTRQVLDIGLSDLVKIPDTTISQSFQSNFTVNNVTPGFEFVNATKTHNLALSDIQLKKVRIQNGQIILKIKNPLNTAVLFKIELPGVSLNNQPFVYTYTLAPGTVQQPALNTETISLAGYEIDLSGAQNLEFNKLQSKLTLQTDPNGPTVSLFNNQIFEFEALFKDIHLDYAKGYFGSQTMASYKQFTLPFMDKIVGGSLALPPMQMSIEISNGFKMALRAQIEQLTNTNTQGVSCSLSAPSIGPSVFMAPAVGTWNTLQPSTMLLTFDGNNSNLQNYVENLGAQQDIHYQIQPNPWGNTSAGNDEAFAHSRLKVKVNAQIPLALNADGLTLQDTFDLHITQDLNKTHVNAAKLIIDATNAFPLASDLVLYFLKNGQVWHTVVADAQIASAAMGQIDPTDGLLKKKSTVQISLPESVFIDLNDLDQVVVCAAFSTTDPNTGLAIEQAIQAGAFLALQMKLQLQTQIKP